jgi:hypothetical protein
MAGTRTISAATNRQAVFHRSSDRGVKEISMTRKKTTTDSLIEMFWKFVQDNPKLAATLAFELGSLAGAAVGNSGKTGKYIQKQAEKVTHALPRSLPTVLKFLPSPKMQPRKRPHAKSASVG